MILQQLWTHSHIYTQAWIRIQWPIQHLCHTSQPPYHAGSRTGWAFYQNPPALRVLMWWKSRQPQHARAHLRLQHAVWHVRHCAYKLLSTKGYDTRTHTHTYTCREATALHCLPKYIVLTPILTALLTPPPPLLVHGFLPSSTHLERIGFI